MSKTFFCVKRGDHLSLGSLPGKGNFLALADSPRPFPKSSIGVPMKINPLYKNVPYHQEKYKVLKLNILSDRATIAAWEASEPDYPLLVKVRYQLEANLKILAEVYGERLSP